MNKHSSQKQTDNRTTHPNKTEWQFFCIQRGGSATSEELLEMGVKSAWLLQAFRIRSELTDVSIAV